MIHLHTLGDSLIKVGEKEVRPTAPLVFAALLYLGMERGRRVPRTALQELLFPSVDERSGAHSLRQLLYKLRQLGAPVESDSSSVFVKPEDVRVDSAADLILSNGHFAKFTLAFLPDYAPGVSEGYEEWLESCRAAVTANARRQLLASMAKYRESVNWPIVERLAHAILDIDPFNEEATLALAEAIALSGAKTEALALLTRYELETGRADLRLPPSVLRRRISESAPPMSGRNLRTPFVGREPDAEALRHQISLARRGESSLMVLAGEAGIGKTRLFEEVSGLAALEGMLVQTVRCQSHYASRPMSVFIELVPALLSARGALGVSPQSLSYLNLLTSHDDNRGDRPTDARDDISRSSVLRVALRDLVDAVATETPLLIAVEDAHWADPDSLTELSGLVQGATKRPLLIVYTTRVMEALRRNATIGEDAIIRRLKALDETSMSLLAERLLPDSGGDRGALAAWCVRTAAGNPFFLQMLCAHYAVTGQPFTVPPDMVSATTRRIERLPQECRRILEFSALLGRHSTVEALKTLAECTQLQLLNAVQRLEEEGYLQIRDESARISHDLLSECTLQLVPPIARRVLHSCVAGNLEQRYETTRDASILWDCAEQWVLSGETGKALEFLKRCARHASHIGKAAQALSLQERAKQLAKHPAELVDVLGEMMWTAKAAGQWVDAYEHSKQLALLRAEPAPSHSASELLSIEIHWMVRMESHGIVRLMECVRATDVPERHRIDAAHLITRMAHELCRADLADTAYSIVAPLLDTESTSYADRILPVIYHSTFGDREEALRLSLKLARDLSSLRSFEDQMRAAHNVAVSLATLGEIETGLGILSDFIAKAEVLGMMSWVTDLASVGAALLESASRIDEADAWLEKAAPTSNFGLGVGRTYYSSAASLAIKRGDIAGARRHIAGLARTGVGDTVRGRAYLRATEIRLEQLDPNYLCDDDTLKDLMGLHEATKSLLTADVQVLALGEALRRRGKLTELRVVLEEYFGNSRRERWPIPPELEQLATSVNVHFPTPIFHS